MERAQGWDGTISVWMKHRDVEVQPLNVILWRIKNLKRMGEDAAGHYDGPGEQYTMKWIDALCKFPPTVLEVLFDGNPLKSLVSALKEADTERVGPFTCLRCYMKDLFPMLYLAGCQALPGA